MSNHRFCKFTGYCERCGIAKDDIKKSNVPVICWNAKAPVVSLKWWRKLKAHNELKHQLEKSVELAMKEN